METILVYQDSVQSTGYDFAKSVRTIKGFGMDPLSIVPAVYDKDGNKSFTEVDELLDYAIGQCRVSAMICGFVTNSTHINSFANAYRKFSSKAPVVARPSLIDDKGTIMVNEEVYYSVCDYLLPVTTLLIINHFEAELLGEQECKCLKDFQYVSKIIGAQFGCAVWILPYEGTEFNNVLFDGAHIRLFTNPEKPLNKHFSLKTAIACQLSVGKKMLVAVRDALECLSEAEDPEPTVEAVEEVAPVEVAAPVVEAAVEAPVVEVVAEEPVVEVAAPVIESVAEVVSAPVVEPVAPTIDFPNSHIEENTFAMAKEEPVEVAAVEPVVEVAEPAPAPVIEPEVKPEPKPTVAVTAVSKPYVPRPEIKRTDINKAASSMSILGGLMESKGIIPPITASELAKIAERRNSGVVEQTTFGVKTTENGETKTEEKTSFSFNRPTISRTAIPTANLLKEKISASTSSTSSLVSPAKSLRDIARSIERPSINISTVSDDESSVPSPAVTSSLKKESDNRRTLNELASLKDRMDKLKSAAEPKPARIDDITASGD